MKEIIINSFDEYREIVVKHKYHEWVYRGQNNAEYLLESSLYRALKRNEDIRAKNKEKKRSLKRELYESEMIELFQRTSHLYLNKYPDKKNVFDWLSIMQHYGSPTRMLDFSFSPYISLYFAIANASSDAAVFCINYHTIKSINETKFDNINEKYTTMMGNENNIDNTILVPFEPEFKNERLFVQQGMFLVPNTLRFSHHEILSKYEKGKNDLYLKIIIKPENFVEIVTELLRMNIQASSIYPGFEGFCKSFETIGILPIASIRHLPNLLKKDLKG